jgi:hypothetical protein
LQGEEKKCARVMGVGEEEIIRLLDENSRAILS